MKKNIALVTSFYHLFLDNIVANTVKNNSDEMVTKIFDAKEEIEGAVELVKKVIGAETREFTEFTERIKDLSQTFAEKCAEEAARREAK